MASKEEVQEKLIEFTARVFKIEAESLTADSSYSADLAAKSVQYNSVIAWMEAEYDVPVNFPEFRKRDTIGECAAYIAGLL